MNVMATGAEPDDREALDDRWLDETLAQSFPASDPLPLFHRERMENVAERQLDDGSPAGRVSPDPAS